MTCSQIDRYVAILVVVICASGCEKTAPRHNASNPADPTPPATLPILVELPDFVLHDQSGKQFGSEQLQGKPWIANFIFTRCPTTCPIQTRQLAKFQKQLKKIPAGEDVELVSITVDPQFDSSAVLAEYAKRMEADLENWHFLTGSRDSIWDLCKKGFKLAVDDAPPRSP